MAMENRWGQAAGFWDQDQMFAWAENLPGGIMGGYFEDNLPFCFMNDCLLRMLGFESREDLQACIQGKLLNLVHPQDRQMVLADLQAQYMVDPREIGSVFRMLCHDGSYRWMMVRGRPLPKMFDRQIMVSVCMDITEQRRLAEEVQRSEERLRIALKESAIGVWEYDIKSHVLTRARGTEGGSMLPSLIENVPQALIEIGYVQPESRSELMRLYSQVEAGEPHVSADLCVRPTQSTENRWERVTFTVVFGEDGNPERAVSVTEDITRQKEAEINYQRELQLRDTMIVGLIAGSRANLSANRVEFLQIGEGQQMGQTSELCYDDMADFGARQIANADDRERYYASFSRQALLRAFARERVRVSVDYRRMGSDGRITWVNATARLVRDAVNGDIYSYSSIRDINRQKTIELALRQRAERDSLTGAYNKETALGMMADAVAQACTDGEGYALILFHVDHYSRLVQRAGYQCADNVIRELYELLQTELRDPKVIGRMFGDEMVCWLGGSPGKAQVCASVDAIRKLARHSAMLQQGDLEITLSVGIAFGDDQPEQSVLLKRAWDAQAQSKEAGGDQYTIYDVAVDAVGSEEEKRPDGVGLEQVDAEETVLLERCIMALSTGKELRKEMRRLLHDLARHFQADQAYLLEMHAKEQTIEQTYDWRDPLKRFETRTVPTTRMMQHYAWLLHQASEKGFFAVDSAAEVSGYQAIFQELRAEDIQLCYIQPVKIEGAVVGYLIVNNAQLRNPPERLLYGVGCLVANSLLIDRMKRRQAFLEDRDELTGICNRVSYLRYIEQLMPDALISLGVIAVDINGLKRLNLQYGQLYGDRMIVYIANEMKRIFSSGNVFRLAGDEFIIVCKNLTANAIQRQVDALKACVEEQYPNGIAAGWVWSDTEIQPEQMAVLADERMMLSKQRYYEDVGVLSRHHDPAAERKLVAELQAGRYEMYLQPKAHIPSGRISGAEALVRYRDLRGGVVLPDRFIPQFEKDGSIRHIDLFIFAEVCRLLNHWQTQGIEPVPISLNFSRTTLLAEDLIAQMERIRERYQVPKQLIEIEITEGMGAIERATMIQLSSEMVRNDYRLALDDFGAKYSNLSILSAIRLHVLKLDRSLVSDLFSNPNTRIVVKNFLIACGELGIRSVAEGVETKEQLDILLELGCDYAQGYYFNKPIPWNDFEKLYLHHTQELFV